MESANSRRELGGEGRAVVGQPGERGEGQQYCDNRADRDGDPIEMQGLPPEKHQRGQYRQKDQLSRLSCVAEPVDQRPGSHRSGRRRRHPSQRSESAAARGDRRAVAAHPGAGAQRQPPQNQHDGKETSAIAAAPAAPNGSPIARRPGTDHTAPKGVQPSTSMAAVSVADTSLFPGADLPIVAETIGAAVTSTASAAIPNRAAPRPPSSVPATDVVSRDPATHIAAPTSPVMIAPRPTPDARARRSQCRGTEPGSRSRAAT